MTFVYTDDSVSSSHHRGAQALSQVTPGSDFLLTPQGKRHKIFPDLIDLTD